MVKAKLPIDPPVATLIAKPPLPPPPPRLWAVMPVDASPLVWMAFGTVSQSLSSRQVFTNTDPPFPPGPPVPPTDTPAPA